MAILLGLVLTAVPALAGAAYYVAPASSGGSDSNNGTSPSTPWATIAKVNSTVTTTGADVYFMRGGSWTGVGLTVDWAGTAQDRVIIGAYGEGAAPVLNGNLNISTWTCSGPTSTIGSYNGMVHVTRDYVTVENLNIIKSGGEGIRFQDADYGIVQNNLIQTIYRRGIVLGGSRNSVVENNTIDLTSLQRVHNPSTYSAGIATVYTTRSAAFNVVRNNIVTRGHGEGIDVIHGSEDTEVYGNVVMTTRSCGLYFDRGIERSIFKHNLIYDPTWPNQTLDGVTVWKASDYKQSSGICVADEYATYGYAEDLKVHGNVVINARYGLDLSRTLEDVGERAGVFLTNNTVINSRENNIMVRSGMTWLVPGFIKNNVFICNDAAHCTAGHAIAPNYGAGLVWDYNVWYGSTVDADAMGANDLTSNPALAKMSGYTKSTVAPYSLNIDDFAPTAGSPIIDSGVDLGASYDPLLVATSDMDVLPFTVVIGSQDAQGTGHERGAVLFMDEEPVTPECGLRGCEEGETCGNCPQDCGPCPTSWAVQNVRTPIWASFLNGTAEDIIGSVDLTENGTVGTTTDHVGAPDRASSNGTSGSNNFSITDAASNNFFDLQLPISASIWVRRVGNFPVKTTRFLSKYYASTNDRAYSFQITNSDADTTRIYVEWSANGTNTFSSGPSASDWVLNQWYHLAFTISSSGALRIYKDGALIHGPITGPTSLHNSGQVFKLFVGVGDSTDPNIDLDDVALWNVELTAAEVAILAGLGTDFDEIDPPPPPEQPSMAMPRFLRKPLSTHDNPFLTLPTAVNTYRFKPYRK